MRAEGGAERRRQRRPDRSLLAFLADIPALIVLERLPTPILIVGENAEICFANGAFAEMLGLDQEALFALPIRRVIPSIGASEAVLAAFHSRAGHIVDLCHENGSTVRARMSRSALLRTDDPGVLVMFTDLTEEIWADPRVAQRR